MFVVASASLPEASMPTVVPTIAFSLTPLIVKSVSVTAPMSNSSTSLIVIAKTRSVNELSDDVARTVTLRLAPSASRSIAALTVTTPVLELIAKRPPSLSCSESEA